MTVVEQHAYQLANQFLSIIFISKFNSLCYVGWRLCMDSFAIVSKDASGARYIIVQTRRNRGLGAFWCVFFTHVIPICGHYSQPTLVK
jgi:hypothetical protein